MSSRRHRGSSMRVDILDLSSRLRQERLYVQHEKAQLQELNDKVKLSSKRLAHTAWVAYQQRNNLDGLIFSSRGQDVSPAICCQRANLLEQTIFQDSYKHLSHHEIVYSEFLRTLREKPKLLATCLTLGDKLGIPCMGEVVNTVFSGIYGNCLLTEDEHILLKLLHDLMRLQLTAAPNPRKLLRQGNCSFSRLYKAFNEQLFAAKLFLTSALYEPILSLLTDGEIFLDIDPSKAIIRFPPQERLKRFGKEGTPEFEKSMREHREFIVSKLESITNRFIDGIRSNLHCFPPSLARLLRTMYSLLMSSGRAEPREVNAVCVDVIFDLFLCPAMVDPNLVGIIDTPISYIARSNLMQVAQILQVLALWKWEEIDPRLMDLYSRFDKEAMSSVLESMLEAGEITEEEEEAGADSGRQSDTNGLSRLSVLMTPNQLEELINFLRTLRESDSEVVDVTELTSLLAPLPQTLPGSTSVKSTSTGAKSDDTSSAESGSQRTSSKKATALASRLSSVANTVSSHAGVKSSNGACSRINGLPGGESPLDENGVVGLAPREPCTVLVIPVADGQCSEPPGFLSEEQVLARTRQASRVVRMNLANLPGGGDAEEIGAGEKRTRFSLSHDDGSIGNTSDNLEAISEAASNHSVDSSLEDEVDQAEDPIIDNLSDMVSANVSGRGTPNVSGRDTPSSQVTEGDEPIGRAAAPGEDDNAQARIGGAARINQVDVAGNEAGGNDRGEGRGGQGAGVGAAPGDVVRGGAGAAVLAAANAAANDEGGGNAPDASARRRQAPPGQGRKNGEPDLEEKFGRFEIKPPPRAVRGATASGASLSEQGDETVSMVSDTWSTDVLASDTETLGEGDGRPGVLEDLVRREEVTRNRLLDELVVPASGDGNLSSTSNLLDVAETASEAWSMDVLASDSESLRLGELDNEDAASVARSDDTRFTDDTTRSDPEPLLDVSCTSVGASSTASNLAAHSSMRHRRDDVTQMRRGLSADVASHLRPSRAAAVEQWARQSSGGGRGSISSASGTAAAGAGGLPRRGSDSSGIAMETKANRRAMESSILKKPVSSSQGGSGTKASSGQGGSASAGGPNSDEVSHLSSHLSTTSIASSESSGESAGDCSKAKKAAMVIADAVTLGQPNNGLSSASPLDNEAPRSAPVASGASVTAATSGSTVATAVTAASSTGAIPKSISFDKTVYDSAGNGYDDHSKHKRERGEKGFFKSFKLPKIGKTGSSNIRGATGSNTRSVSVKAEGVIKVASGEELAISLGQEEPSLSRTASDETSDDILAKYRKKSASQTDSAPDSNDLSLVDAAATDAADERLVIDPQNVEASYAFEDAKRKLRLMLSEADLSALSSLGTGGSTGRCGGGNKKIREENELVWLLKVQLAEANNLQDRGMVAQLHETLRCLSLFDADGLRKLLRALKEDYRRRTPYLAYLVRCRQGLLSTLSQQQRLLSRMEVDQRVCSQVLVSVCVRLFLERREKQLQQFVTSFRETSVADEKTASVESFLAELWTQLEEEPTWALVASQEQMKLGCLTVERAVVSHIYMNAMYPNGEADVSRDQVLSAHMGRLSEGLTPAHRDLRVPRQYHYEAPWPSAQAEIRRLAAYKTASDKVACVVRCSQTIMNLLSLASGRSVPAADDFVPVMVFVLIKANPPSLLSTVQYVDSFYGNRLSGEDQYWWMQFVAAIEFIKTMD